MITERRRNGVTLLELIIVFMIIGILAAISIPNFRKARQGRPRLGFAVGGAMDSVNFRENIDKGYLPLASAITTEGIYNEYYFDTGMVKDEEATQLFYPTYTTAVSRNPLTGELENYVSVGLNSNLSESEFKRRKLNLVVVLDISGSMASKFNNYYYGGQKPAANANQSQNKDWSMLQIAAENISNMLEHLNEDDSFSLVLFDDTVATPFALQKISDNYKNNLRNYVKKLTPKGSTNMEIGIEAAINQYKNYKTASDSEYENRIIFLTDAMPNTGRTSSNDLLSLAEGAAANRIHSTFIGIGLAFNAELINRIAKVQGANYFSVQSADDFKERMDDNFKYMVCPLVYNLSLKMISTGYQIEKVYGSPDSNVATGELMKVSCLFPSPVNEDNETKGGLILLRLKKIGNTGDLKLVVNYEMNDGFACSSEAKVAFEATENESYYNTGIRKGILLARYVEAMNNWISSERRTGSEMYGRHREVWENESVKLVASDENRAMLRSFKTYLASETVQINDQSLNREITLIDKILSSSVYIAQFQKEYDNANM
ncbi:MAG: VWA domain-containing protein [Candidatus Riflebacteria bacterium]|nr:VWA domain-containing protein [Candidatus Riflebacteria bacterium]